MKNKPVRHKETNTFKFKRFADRISEIDVDVFHRVAHRNEENDADEESLESNFYKTLTKWNDLNLTEGYTSFKNEVKHVITLPQLINHKEEVIASLTKYLEMKNVAFLQPILEMVIATAKDLQIDFYEYFPHFLTLIIDLLNMKDPEIVEYAFTTLAYLFKFLWRYLVKNIDKTFKLLLPLLVDSKPSYINNFAAESFAFVARKVRDREAFLKLLFTILEETPNGVVGCGKLLFEVISGISGQFHSCAESMLNLYLDALINDCIDQKLAFDVLHQVFTCIATQINFKHNAIFWEVVVKKLDDILLTAGSNEKKNEMLMALIKLIIPVVEYKYGKILQNPSVLISRIIKGISIYETQSENILIEMIDLSATILLAEGIKLSQETCNELVSKLMSISNRKMLIYAIKKLINHSSFETLVLPMTLQRSILREELTDEELDLFTEIITSKVPPSLNGYEKDSWRKLNLDLRTFPVKIRGLFKDKLENWKHVNYETNLINEDSLKVVVILPHIIPINEDLIKELKNIFVSVYETLMNENCESNIGRKSFAFLLILHTMIRIMNEKTFEEFLEEHRIDFLKLIERYYNDQNILNSLDLFYTYISKSEYNKKYLNKETFDKLNENLVKQLGSPFSRIRSTVCHLYSLFANVKEIFVTEKEEDSNVLKHLFMAENVEVTVQTYRNRLIHLEALSFETRGVTNLNPKYYECSLRYLLGNLYINFSLLWNPVIKAIASYADEQCAQFWPILMEELKQDNEKLHANNVTNICDIFECNSLQNLSKRLEINDKPDFDNYKYLLWKCLSEFPGYCESRNRDFTVLFIELIERNYFKANSDTIKAYSIEKRQEIDDTLLEKAEESDEEEEDEESNEKEDEQKEKVNKEKPDKNSKNQKLRKTGKPIFKILLAQLKLLSLMQNPRVLYKEAELNEIYMTLLTFKSPELQKSVLDCIFAYKRKNLLPYKDHLYGLIDEKNLRNELARFKIADDEETEDTIQPEHREFLMPILMRIIYAKLVTRGSGRAAGAAGGLARRKIILRFLMGVKEEEMILFAKMAFKPLERYNIDLSSDNKIEDLTQLTTLISEKLSLSNVIPPARLRSAVNLLGIVIEEFGAKMSNNLLPKLLAMLICVFAEIKSILEKSENVLLGFLSTIKELRTSCFGILTRFFAHFETYPWSPSELDAVFDVAVFPWLEKLPFEGIYSPTAFLKLLSTWCHNSRYFCLLVKHKNNNKNFSPLPFIMKLLLNEKIHPGVANVILEMIEKLLTLADYESVSENAMEVDDALPKIPIYPRNVIEIDPNAVLPGSTLNYGSAILFPYVSDILNYIKRKLKRFKMNVNKVETTVLSRISELNLDSDSSNILLSLLLPILVKKASRGESEDTIIDLLTTIANLMKTVTKPEIHIRAILPLLLNISSAPPRRLLLTLLEAIANNVSNSSESLSKEIMIKNISVLKNLNAVNEKWLEHPDYDKRIDAFSEINAMISGEDEKSHSLNVEFGVAVLYNCFYFLYNESDLAMKDSSGQCLNALGPKLVKICKNNPSDRKYLIDDTILNLIKDGMKNRNNAVRFQSISFLGVMAMECSDDHPVFQDLHLLTNKNDPDGDFFENLLHLQLHKKVRALLKFCSVSKTLKKPPNTKTLTQFIFPVASFYLCNESFTGKNSIVDSAIETVGTVCRLLPWYHYSLILKIYLSKLRTQSEFRKQIVRVIVAILDAFHYDLSKLKTLNESLIGEKEEIQDIKNLNEPKKNQKEEVQDSEKSTNVEMTSEQEKVDSTDLIEQSTEKKDEVDQNDEKVDHQITITAEELLEEKLAQENEDEEEIEEESEEENEKSVDKEPELEVEELIMEKQTILSPSEAKKLVFEITHTFLPQLNRSILARTQHEMSHKLNRKQHGIDKEEEELMRVPIALALVKLLQKLPENLIERNLPGIFMKLCTFLKSRLDSVRRATREILQKIMITLGPNYLHYLLRETNSLLTKGFQIHVLAYTIQAVLTSLKPFLTPTHMNDNLQSILQVCKVDLFGLSAEEKEVTAITKNVSEAKSTKSFDIFHILSQFINESCLVDLVQPLSDVLNETRSHKTVRKVTECLRHTVLGLADNTFIPSDKMLIFLYGIVSKSIPSFNPNKKKDKENEKSSKSPIEKPDCYIIPPEPKSRSGIKASAKTTGSTNDHIMLEFGLKLLHILLKREKVAGDAFESYLNPFVTILSDCLTSQHVKLSTLALQCLNWVLKMDLEAVHTNIKEICSLIFKILHKYGVAGLKKGDNFDLVMAAFKTMSVIIRDLKDFEMTYDEVKVLVLYAEQDLHDYEKQATAFNLLRAIIGRRLNVFQIHRVMKKVAVLSITSDSENVRQQCRAVFYQFLMEYPLGEKLDKHLRFYLTQMDYEVQSGRLSALEMLHSIIIGFPSTVLVDKSEILFIMISVRLVNDDDPTCRKHAAQCIKQIITRVPHNQRSKLFDIILAWFQDTIIMHRRLAAQLCGIFVTTEKNSFETRLESVLPLIIQQFTNDDEQKNDDEPGKFVRRKKRKREHKVEEFSIEDEERIKDHHAFQVLQLTLKISSNCPIFLKSDKYVDSIQFIAERSQEYLAHPHLWVRLAAAQQIGFILATINEDKLIKLIQATELKANSSEDNNIGEDEEKVKGYIYSSPLKTLKSLSLDLIAQLQPGIEVEEFFDQVVKNLVFISRVIKTLSWNKTSLNENKNEFHSGISNFWMMKWLRKCINIEIVQNSKSINVRTAVFKWIAGVVATIPVKPFLEPILFQMISPLVREMMIAVEPNPSLKQLAKDVAKMIKKKIGDEEYVRLLMKVQEKIDTKKAERRKTQTQRVITDPEFAAKKKIIRQQRKREAKKRKNSQIRGKKFGVKKRKTEGDFDLI
ncbi:small subunit processome component 20 homolog [Chelonus insularis]|uniref:small subunit processome component 20 homolog n=1 Tax=Chelonus insularis TaxID=460826 RepID=UPI001589CA46|nr:small subunit processome component 20 homolog [Chelonus insularis]